MGSLGLTITQEQRAMQTLRAMLVLRVTPFQTASLIMRVAPIQAATLMTKATSR